MSLQEKSSVVVMEEGYSGTNDTEPRRSVSNDRTSSATSSLRRRSLTLSHVQPSQIDDDDESECVSEAGDIGDRALHSNRHSESGSVCLFPSEDVQLQTYGLWGRDPVTSKAISPVTPLPKEIIPPISTDAIISDDKNPENTTRLPKLLEYGSCMTHLAVFGILGVSSFLMGWFGVVFKGDISCMSDYLVIGLSTGYLGSLTTFSGWNQKMLELSVEGHWVFAVLNFLIAYFIIFGVETAKGFRQILERNSVCGFTSSRRRWRVDSYKRHLVALAVLLLMLSSLWSISGILLREEFNSSSSEAQLWLGCMVGPFGVWIWWFLAWLNGRRLGKTGLLKWVPFGTLIANVSEACVVAALSNLSYIVLIHAHDFFLFNRKSDVQNNLFVQVNTKTCDIVATGIQFGFLDCLSTVSTFIAKFNAMRESKYPWRAYAYAMATICISFRLGILIYCVPVWTRAYK